MANTTLKRDFTTDNGNVYKWTYSFWVKRGSLGSNQCMIGVRYSGDYTAQIRFTTNDQLEVHDYRTAYKLQKITNRKFRDTSGWYHIVVSNDNSVSSPDTKIYVNGVEETSFATDNEYSQNDKNSFNDDYPNYIGEKGTGDQFDGYISHLHFIDGTAYAASTFGSTDATTGEWKINTSPSVNYGTNGFLILKDGNTITDQSPNSNNFTLDSGTLTKSEDCPSNVFATMNPLDNYYAGSTFTNGNNTVQTTGGNYTWNTSTLGLTTGKWYWEVKYEAKSNADNFNLIGIAERPTESSTQFLGGVTAIANYGYYSDNGGVYAKSGSTTSYGNTYTVGDIIGVALDLDNNKLYFHKNGTYQNSGVPTSGSTGTGAISIDAVSTLAFGQYFAAAGDYGGGSFNVTNSFNFGNGYFGTTAVSSAGTNASGIGIFEYDVPTGYTAISTKGLNL